MSLVRSDKCNYVCDTRKSTRIPPSKSRFDLAFLRKCLIEYTRQKLNLKTQNPCVKMQYKAVIKKDQVNDLRQHSKSYLSSGHKQTTNRSFSVLTIRNTDPSNSAFFLLSKSRLSTEI